MLKREDICKERIDEIISTARKYGEFEALTHEERHSNRRRFLKNHSPKNDLWIFGYGSLIWNPAFNYAQKKLVRLYGYHRKFCLHLTIGRGSPEKPGLMLALDRGGSCNGVAFRIRATDIESETEILWMREMISGAYKPVWVTLSNDFEKFKGFTFVVNRKHSRYTGNLDIQSTAKAILRGEGYLGSCKDYLFNTVQSLMDGEIYDSYLNRLAEFISKSSK